MYVMSDYSGEDLLKVFKELDIQLVDLDSNVVKAWFDTDDKKMQDLLSWMCSSLSKKNYISPLELTEYKDIEKPLTNKELEIEQDVLENKYPGIFDLDLNMLEVEFLEADLQLAQQQEKELDLEIETNRSLNDKLSRDLTNKVKEEIESSIHLRNTQEKCLLESKKLDEINKKIHQQIVNFTKILNNFEFNPSPTFISNFKINVYQEKVEMMLSTLQSLLEDSFVNKNLTTLTSGTYLDTMPIDETVANDLSNMYHRIFHSQNQYLATKVEVEKFKAVLSYLENMSIESLLSYDEGSLKQNIAVKMETKKRLCDMLEDSIKKFVEFQVSQTQIKYMEHEVKMQQQNLTELTQLEVMIQKLLAHYSVLRIMFDEEKKEMEGLEKFFHRVINSVHANIDTAAFRIEKMKDIIESYNNSSSQEHLKFIKTITKLLSSSNEEHFTINRAYELISDFNREVDFLESKLFSPCFGDVKEVGKEMRRSVKTLQSFLISGPTHRVLLVPHELQLLLRQVDDMLKKELESITCAMTAVSSSKKSLTKWQNYRRQLWMYFYADPGRMKFILQEIQEELENSNVKKRF